MIRPLLVAALLLSVPAEARKKRPDATIVSVDATHYEIDLDAVVHALLAALDGEVVARPAPGGGYALEALAPGSIFRRLGLEENDTIRKVGGVTLKGVDSLREAYAAARAADRLEVELVRAGKPLTIEYALGTSAPRRRPAPVEGIKKVSSTKYRIDRATVDKILADPASVAGAARVVPSIRDGKPTGFKLYAIRPGSLFAALGLENGDTIHAVNGHELTSPDKALEAYTALRDAKKLTIELTRRGKPAQLVWEIR